jgi:hypothetical protein
MPVLLVVSPALVLMATSRGGGRQGRLRWFDPSRSPNPESRPTGRDRGRRLEPGLWESWDGAPTLRLLRFRGGDPAETVQHRHDNVAAATARVLPSAEQEAAEPETSDIAYQDALVACVSSRGVRTITGSWPRRTRITACGGRHSACGDTASPPQRSCWAGRRCCSCCRTTRSRRASPAQVLSSPTTQTCRTRRFGQRRSGPTGRHQGTPAHPLQRRAGQRPRRLLDDRGTPGEHRSAETPQSAQEVARAHEARSPVKRGKFVSMHSPW